MLGTWAPGVTHWPTSTMTPRRCCTLRGATSFVGTFTTGPVKAFGLEMEPEPFQTFTMTLTLSDGTVITQPVAGQAGASFFGWTAGAITSFTASCSVCGFAIGDIVKAEATAAVPVPGTLGLLSVGLVSWSLAPTHPPRSRRPCRPRQRRAAEDEEVSN